MAQSAPETGDLVYQLRFERAQPATNRGGVVKSGWATISGLETRWADVQLLMLRSSAGEEILNGRMTGHVRYTIWIRNDAESRTLRSGDRAVNINTGEIYNIGQPSDPYNTREWLMIDAQSAGNAEGQG